GASSGLGLALTKRVLARGDRVIAAVRTPSKLSNVFSDDESSRVNVLEMDVTEPYSQIKGKIDSAVKKWGPVDVLVNNAGLGIMALTEEGGCETMMQQMQTNFFGVLNVTNAVLPYLRERMRGTIVIIGSRSAWRNEFAVRLYSASKAAVHSYGETLAAELQPFNIRVLIVAPGSFRTPGIYPPTIVGDPLPGYERLRADTEKRLTTLVTRPNQGDPMRGMDVVVDVVKGEGREEPSEWPLWLFLGEDAMSDVRAKIGRITKALDAWESVGSNLGFLEKN
ncbi:hypothetical protein HETIRDRAFT_331537, partial [Heterobasidion irregulare TC 32-1]